MNLPNYFIADLPPEAVLTPALIEEACQTLKRNREQYLAKRATPTLIRVLSDTAENWLQPDYPFRKLALEQGPPATGFSAATLANGLDAFFRQVTAENLRALLVQDFGDAQRLDELSATNAELVARRSALVNAPEFLVHIAAGSLPVPVFMSVILGVLLRSAQFVKCAHGTSLLPRLFAHSLYEADAKLAACLEIADWRGGNLPLETALFKEADCITATGSDETLSEIRHHVPARTRFVGYGHRVSFGYVTAEALAGFNSKKTVMHAATDIVAWDQHGCLSPHVIYVEHGGGVSAEQFAEMLAAELAKREQDAPRGALPAESAAVIASRRAFYEVRAAHSPDTRHWCSENSTAWTVVFENDPQFQLSCLNRFIYIKAVTDLTHALQGADGIRGHVSTVGLAATEDRAPALVTQLSRWGVTRVCPLGKMQEPPLLWRHDGRPALGDLVTWTDWEQ